MKHSSHALAVIEPSELERVAGGYMDWDTDWCGTRVPGWPRPRQDSVIDAVSLVSGIDLVALNPQPLPPGEIGLQRI